MALSWLLAQKSWIVPIPGTTKISRLQENIGGAELILTADELGQIKAAADKIELKGERYSAIGQKMINRD